MESNLRDKESPVMKRAAALMAALPEARRDIEDLLASLSEADLDRPTVHTAWTVREAFGHIIDSTELVASYLERAKAGDIEGQQRPREMAPALEKSAVARSAGMNLSQISAAFKTAADRALTLFGERVESGDWEGPVPHLYLGTVPAVQAAGFVLLDWFIHPWDIRDALGRNPQPNPRHAALIAVGLVGLLPRRLDTGEAAKMSQSATYRYIIESEPPAIFDVVIEYGQARVTPRPADEGEAELVFKGKPSELALGMLGRRSAAPFLQKSSPEALARFQKLWISL